MKIMRILEVFSLRVSAEVVVTHFDDQNCVDQIKVPIGDVDYSVLVEFHRS